MTFTESPKFHIAANGLGKKFYHRWVFRNVAFDLTSTESLVITGANGAGKSTLLRVVSGMLQASEGKISYKLKDNILPIESRYKYTAWSSPAHDLYLDLTLEEQLAFHFSMVEPLVPVNEIVALLHLEGHRQKRLKYFSSGMLQRVKTGLALLSDRPLLLLDEPTGFMDEDNRTYMLDMIQFYTQNRILIMASNLPREIERFSHKLNLV